MSNIAQDTLAIADRLKREEEEYDEAATGHMACTKLQKPMIGRYIESGFMMSHRFNRVMDRFEKQIPLKGLNVLGCGCGSAFYEIAMSKRGANVWAYDISPGMLNLARHNADLHETKVNLFKSDELNLTRDFEANKIPKFDLVTGASIIHHLAEPNAFIEAIDKHCSERASAIFMEPVATPLVDSLRHSRLNPDHALQTEHEEVWSVDQYKEFLLRSFTTVEVWYKLNLFSGAQRSLRGTLGGSAVDWFSGIALPADRILSSLPLFSSLAWHAVFVAKR